MEISGIPDKELKITIIRLFTKFQRRMSEQSDNFNREKI